MTMETDKNQSDLFDPASRATDPITSHIAEAKINLGERAKRMQQVYALVCRYPGCTTGELARHMLREFPELPVRTAVESPHKRISDLEKRGLVERGGMRQCLDTGNQCLTWHPAKIA